MEDVRKGFTGFAKPISFADHRAVLDVPLKSVIKAFVAEFIECV